MIWLFAALLVGWGNFVNYLVRPTLPGGDWAAVAWGLCLATVSLGVARVMRLARADIGLVIGDARVTAVAALIGLAAAGIGTAALRVGPLVGGPVRYTPLFTTTAPALAAHIAFFLPLAAAIPEELAFRGTLLGGLRRTHGVRTAVIGSSIVFALWHVFVVWVTILQTSLANGSPAWLEGAAALLFVAVGGAALAYLRMRSRTLVAPILAHWTFDAALLVGLWA